MCSGPAADNRQLGGPFSIHSFIQWSFCKQKVALTQPLQRPETFPGKTHREVLACVEVAQGRDQPLFFVIPPPPSPSTYLLVSPPLIPSKSTFPLNTGHGASRRAGRSTRR